MFTDFLFVGIIIGAGVQEVTKVVNDCLWSTDRILL